MADNQFPAFLETIDDNSKPLASEINDFLLAQGCKCEIKTANCFLYPAADKENSGYLRMPQNRRKNENFSPGLKCI